MTQVFITRNNNHIHLLEISDPSLQDCLKNNTAEIKGSDEDEAVLCTPTQTFRLRQVHTSNSHLILSPSASTAGLNLIHSSTDFLEAVPIAGKTDRLESMLRSCAYDGLDHA